jgi:hypothetical protein
VHVHVPSSSKCQNLIGQLRSEHGGVMRFLEQDHVIEAFELLAQQYKVPRDHQEQVVEVVSNAAGQMTDRFHLLRVRQAPLALPQGCPTVSSITIKTVSSLL